MGPLCRLERLGTIGPVTAIEVLEWATRIAFLGLAFIAIRTWARTRHRSAAWLAVTFVDLGLVVSAGLVGPDEPEGVAAEAFTRALVVVLLLFPYLLYRFADSFEPGTSLGSRVAALATGAAAVATIALPDFPAEGDPHATWFTAYTIGILVFWVALSLAVAQRLWRAGQAEPRLARRRMRLLGGAAVVLAGALVISGLAGDASDEEAVVVAVQLVALLSAGLFMSGYAPPRLLRDWWRRREHERLREAEFALMEALEPDDVLEILLPHAAELVGARSVTFQPAAPLVTSGPTAASRPDTVWVDLRGGRLVAEVSPYAPLFGDEEIQLLRGLGAIADLALERSRLFVAEQQARREAERSNEELEQFAYAASHDLKAPLSVVSGFTQLLRQRHRDDLGDDAEYLEVMSQTIARMSGLIDDLLALSRIGSADHELEDTALADVVADALANLDAEVRQTGAEITVGDLPHARLDRSLAVLILQNLIGNALKYSGGSTPRVKVGARANGAWTTVEVVDEGEGIDPEAFERIFTPFVRLHGEGDDEPPGTGIGLALVKKAVAVHGGDIEVESAPGKGSTFRFTVPAGG